MEFNDSKLSHFVLENSKIKDLCTGLVPFAAAVLNQIIRLIKIPIFILEVLLPSPYEIIHSNMNNFHKHL